MRILMLLLAVLTSLVSIFVLCALIMLFEAFAITIAFLLSVFALIAT